MFKFLKIFGKKSKKKEKETTLVKVAPKKLTIKELSSFYSKFEKEYQDKFMDDMKDYAQKVLEHKKSIKSNLQKLSKAKLRNPNLTQKELNFVTGNKETFITFVNAFTDDLNYSNEFDDILEFSQKNEKRIKDFLDNSKRQVAILSNYFANELKKVMIAIGDYKHMIEDFDSNLKSYKFDILFQIQSDIEVLEKLKTDYAFHADIVSKLNSKLETQEKFRVQAKEGIDNLKNSLNMKKVDDLKQELNQYFSKRNNLELKFTSYMNTLSKPLKKYAHISFENSDLLEKYLDDPVNSLVNDKSFKILDILNNLSKAIKNNNISIKNENKILKTISEITKPFCVKFIKEYESLDSNIKKLEENINTNQTVIQINELNDQLYEINTKIEDLKRKHAQAVEILNKIRVKDVAKKIEKPFSKHFNTPILIKV